MDLTLGACAATRSTGAPCFRCPAHRPLLPTPLCDARLQVGGLTVNVARAQNLKSVSTMTTQDPYVKAKLLVDGFQVCFRRSSNRGVVSGASGGDKTKR